MTFRETNPVPVAPPPLLEAFATDVQYYLTRNPRQLPSRYLYDELGSALFEAICRLPWYPLTRAEKRLLRAHAGSVFDALHPVATVLELGAGSGDKLVALLRNAGPHPEIRDVHLVDISPSALAHAGRTLAALGVHAINHEATYEAGLAEFAINRGPGRALVLFLGSNIGNFDPPGVHAFLRKVRSALVAHDALLLGTDLVKPEPDLLLAYDDPLGVTAAFNRNLLVRINRELDGTFDLGDFAHRAVWNERESRVEMHLVSRRAQRIQVNDAGLDFEMDESESIWTESSYKFQPEQVLTMLGRAGFRVMAQWRDAADGFALTLAEASP